jgi:hypothetical protein
VGNVAVFRITEMDIPNGYSKSDAMLCDRLTIEVADHELSTLYSLTAKNNSYENLNTKMVLSCALRNNTAPLSVCRYDRTVKITSQCTFVESSTDLITSTLNGDSTFLLNLDINYKTTRCQNGVDYNFETEYY